MVRLKVFLLLLLGFSVSARAQGQAEPPVNLTIGGRNIVVPTPGNGFARCDGINPDWDSAMTATLPPTNRLLALFGTTADRDAIREGNSVDFSRNFSIQTIRSEENREIGTKTFSQVVGGIRKELDLMKGSFDAEYKKLAEQGSEKLSKDLGVDTSLEFSRPAVLGYFEEGETSLGFTIAMNVGVQSGEFSEQNRAVVAALIRPVNGRITLLYSAANYKGESDREEAERSVKAWGDAIIAANPVVEGSSTSLFSGTPKAALIGGLIGFAGALVLLLKKRLSAKSTSGPA